MNPYVILGIDKTATRDQIDAAYREKVKKYHPDVGGDAWVFRQVQTAYDALTRGMSGIKRDQRQSGSGDSTEQEPARNGTASEEHVSSPSEESTADRRSSAESGRQARWADSGMASAERVRPWIRFWARLFDTWIATLVVGFVVGLVYPAAAEWNELFLGMALLFAYCFIEPVFFGIFGTTPGKALLGIDVRTPSGDCLSYGQATRRSLHIWFYGWGMGLPLVSLATLSTAYSNLTQGITTWDRLGNFHVSHRRIGVLRGTIAMAFIVGLFVLLRNLHAMAENQSRSQILGSADYSRVAPIAADANLLRAEACCTRADVRLQAGDIRGAIDECNEAIRLKPTLAIAHAVRGCVYALNGDGEKAIVDCNYAIRLDSTLAIAYGARGFAYVGKGDYDRALADCAVAIRLDPECPIAYAVRGGVYARNGEYDKALPDCNKAIRLKPEQAEAYWVRGVVYAERGDISAAIADYTEAIRLKPDFPEARFLRGSIYLGRSEYDNVIADLNEAIRLDPKRAEAYTVRAAAYAGKGGNDKVIADCTAAIRLDPKQAEAYAIRGTAYERKGDLKSARRDIDEAKSLGLELPGVVSVEQNEVLRGQASGQGEQSRPPAIAQPQGRAAGQGRVAEPWIHKIVRAKDTQLVRAMVQLNPHYLLEMEEGSFGYTPLHTAAENGLQEMVELLLVLGADVNVRARNGETPLITAVGEHHLDLAMFLIAKGADVKACNCDGETALHLAAIENMPTLAQTLIDKGAVVDAKTTDGKTPLNLTSEKSREVIQVLLTNGARIRGRREDGKTQR